MAAPATSHLWRGCPSPQAVFEAQMRSYSDAPFATSQEPHARESGTEQQRCRRERNGTKCDIVANRSRKNRIGRAGYRESVGRTRQQVEEECTPSQDGLRRAAVKGEKQRAEITGTSSGDRYPGVHRIRKTRGDVKIAGCREIANLTGKNKKASLIPRSLPTRRSTSGIRRTFSREIALLVDYNATVCQGARAASAERRAHRHDRKRRSRERRKY